MTAGGNHGAPRCLETTTAGQRYENKLSSSVLSTAASDLWGTAASGLSKRAPLSPDTLISFRAAAAALRVETYLSLLIEKFFSGMDAAVPSCLFIEGVNEKCL